MGKLNIDLIRTGVGFFGMLFGGKKKINKILSLVSGALDILETRKGLETRIAAAVNAGTGLSADDTVAVYSMIQKLRLLRYS